MSKDIVLVPLDSRPVNSDIPKLICAAAGLECEIPDQDMLGKYMTPGNCDKIADWLLKKSAENYVLSLDMLLYGGLVASRGSISNPYSLQKGFSAISELKKKNPNSKILCFSTIRRLSTTVYSEESMTEWQNMNCYLKAFYSHDLEMAAVLKKKIKPDVIQQYDLLRKRNFENNIKAIELVSKGSIDFLLLPQEDCFPNGPQTQEQLTMSEKILSLGLSEKVFLHNGADEAAQELVSKVANPREKKISVLCDCPSKLNEIMEFEDRPFQTNLFSHMKALNFIQDYDSQTILYIAFAEPQTCVRHIKTALAYGKKVILLDLIAPNGGCKELISEMIRSDLLRQLCGYSAWNTASNSLGTALAFCAFTDMKINRKRISELLVRNLVDDFLYQRIYRQVLDERFKKDIHNMQAVDKKTREDIKKEFVSCANKFLTESGFRGVQITDFCFPWERTFECSVTCSSQ